MKTSGIKNLKISIVVLLMLTTSGIYAQGLRNNANRNYPNQQCQYLPDLTEDQQSKIEALRVDHMKEVTAHRNKLNELRAKKQTLMTAEAQDLDEVNSVIDQMTNTQNKMMKSGALHRQKVRNLLTDKQKVYFDNKPMRGHRYGRGAGRGNGNGSGYGRRGYGRGYNCSNSIN